MLQKNEGGALRTEITSYSYTYIIWNIKMLQKMGGGHFVQNSQFIHRKILFEV